MIITNQGGLSVRISQGDLALEINPENERFKADVSLFSVGHPSFDRESFVIAGPGEYEVKDVAVKGFLSETKLKGSKLNTVYLINMENINLCFLGPISELPDSKTLESLEDIDILFVPAGDEGALTPAEANKLAVSLEPSLIIPIHYTDASLKQFLKESGEDKVTPIEKLVIKKKDLEGKKSEVILLKQE
jgi:L-ascorbate metabolism protein UlaG (beta-lactamase superfamily)